MNIIRNKLAGLDEVLPLLVFWEMIYLLVGEAIIWILLPVDKPYIGPVSYTHLTLPTTERV